MVKSQLGVRSAVCAGTVVRGVQTLRDGDFTPDKIKQVAAKSFQPFFIVHGDYMAPGARAHFRAMVPTFFEDMDSLAGTTEEERRKFFGIERSSHRR